MENVRDAIMYFVKYIWEQCKNEKENIYSKYNFLIEGIILS